MMTKKLAIIAIPLILIVLICGCMAQKPSTQYGNPTPAITQEITPHFNIVWVESTRDKNNNYISVQKISIPEDKRECYIVIRTEGALMTCFEVK
jgi:uncharacterized lipoprotein YajG